jgi:hypothetical protein
MSGVQAATCNISANATECLNDCGCIYCFEVNSWVYHEVGFCVDKSVTKCQNFYHCPKSHNTGNGINIADLWIYILGGLAGLALLLCVIIFIIYTVKCRSVPEGYQALGGE